MMKSTARAHLYVTAISDQGRQRRNNEDRYAVSAHLAGPANNVPSLLALVCDGIGGHQAGEIAAEIAVELISSYVAQSDGTKPLEILTRAVSLTSDAIFAESQKDSERNGMGATCVCAWVLGDQLFSASLGDSRLLLLRDDTIQQLTKDHTWVQDAIDAGVLNPENARSHPNVHVIRRYLGAPESVTPDLRLILKPGETEEEALANQGLKLKPGDILLLCTDGLSDLVQPAEILENIGRLGREAGAKALVELANQRGGHDNTTLVLLEMPPESAKMQIPIPDQKSRTDIKISPKIIFGCVVVSIVLVLVAAIILSGVFWYINMETHKLPTPSAAVATAETTLPVQYDFVTPSAAYDQPVATLPIATLTPWPTNVP